MKNKKISKILLGIAVVSLVSGCTLSSTPKEEKKETVQETKKDDSAEVSLNTLGIKYTSKKMPAWGIEANIPDGWNATVDKEKAVVFFTSSDSQYAGIEISFKHTYNGSNVPALLRKDFDYYYLNDFVYHDKDNKKYHTTDYEPQNINVIKDNTKKVWVDAEAEMYPNTNERGDPNSYYMEYDEKQEGMSMREDYKIIAVQENPKLRLLDDSRKSLDNHYITAYYVGYAESERAVALSVIGSKEQTKEIDDIAKTIAYSIQKLENSESDCSLSLDKEMTFADTKIKIPTIQSEDHLSITDDYTSPFFHTYIINTFIKNDTGLSFKEFYKSEELPKIIEKEFYCKAFTQDEKTKSASISGGIVKECTLGGHNALVVALSTETRSSKASIKELIRSKSVLHYSKIMLVDVGNNTIAMFAIVAPEYMSSYTIKTLEAIFE